MKFEFGIATDITVFAKKQFLEMYDIYDKVFICPDVNDYHILRVLVGYGEDYELNKDKVVLEHQKIPKAKTDSIGSLAKLKSILEEDDGGNWDYLVKDSVEECLEIIDGGFGLN